MYGCYLKEVNYGDVNYGSSEAVTVAMTISYDNAMQVQTETSSGGVGTVGGLVGTSGGVATG